MFSIVLGVIFLVLDLYVLWRFQVFARRNAMSPWWSRTAWMIAAIALALYVVVAVRRHLFRMDGMDLTLFMLVCLWYFPKLPAAIALGLAQMVRGVKSLVGKLRSKPKPPVDQVTLPGRRMLLEKAAWSTVLVPYGMVANGIVRTLYDFTVYRETVVLPGLPRAMDGFCLVQISDIHAGSFPDDVPFAEAMRLVRSCNPDAVVITGDFVNALPDEMSSVSRELAKLAASYPVYATLGNHDHYNSDAQHRALIQGIRELNIDLLMNEHRRIGSGDDGFVLVGIDNVGFRQNYGNLAKAMRNVDPGEPTILLAHDPTYWDKAIVAQQPIELMLSGHTHGGQINIGMLGVNISPASFVYEQVAGMYRKGDQLLYVNRGLGTVGPPMRIGVPPEITVITLKAPGAFDNLA